MGALTVHSLYVVFTVYMNRKVSYRKQYVRQRCCNDLSMVSQCHVMTWFNSVHSAYDLPSPRSGKSTKIIVKQQ